MSAGIGDKKIRPRYFLYRVWRLLAPYWFTLIILNALYVLVDHSFYYKNILYFFGDVIPVLDIIGRPFDMLNGVFCYMNFTLVLIFVLPLIYLITKNGTAAADPHGPSLRLYPCRAGFSLQRPICFLSFRGGGRSAFSGL